MDLHQKELNLVLLWTFSFGREEIRKVMELDLSRKLVLIDYKEWWRWGIEMVRGGTLS